MKRSWARAEGQALPCGFALAAPWERTHHRIRGRPRVPAPGSLTHNHDGFPQPCGCHRTPLPSAPHSLGEPGHGNTTVTRGVARPRPRWEDPGRRGGALAAVAMLRAPWEDAGHLSGDQGPRPAPHTVAGLRVQIAASRPSPPRAAASHSAARPEASSRRPPERNGRGRACHGRQLTR